MPMEIESIAKLNRVVTIYGKEQYDGNDKNSSIGGYMEQRILSMI